jgi:hypothetical protein
MKRADRISKPRRCWYAAGERPMVKLQVVREHTYLCGALSPEDGRCHFVILPALKKNLYGHFS